MYTYVVLVGSSESSAETTQELCLRCLCCGSKGQRHREPSRQGIWRLSQSVLHKNWLASSQHLVSAFAVRFLQQAPFRHRIVGLAPPAVSSPAFTFCQDQDVPLAQVTYCFAICTLQFERLTSTTVGTLVRKYRTI